jgi:hypothetical protein
MLSRPVKAAVVLLPIIGLMLAASSVLAAGVGVTPGKMEFRVRPGGMEVQTLSIINPSDEELQFLVYVEGEHEEWFKVTPSEFTLSPRENRDIEVAVTPPITAFIDAKDHDLSICVVSLLSGYNLNVGAGVKVAAHVQLLEFPLMAVQWWIVTAVLIVALVMGIIVGRRRRVRYG